MENPLFKCGRCHHLFRQFPGATPPAAPAPMSRRGAAPEPDSDTLEFIFPDRPPAAALLPDRPPAAALLPDRPPAAEPVLPAAAVQAAPLVVEAALPVIERTAVVVAEERDDDGELTAVVTEPTPSILTTPLDAEPEFALGDPEPIDDELLAEPALDEEGPSTFDEVSGDDGVDYDDEDDDDGEDDEPMAMPVEPVAAARTLHVEDTMRAPAGFGTIMRGMGLMVSAFAVLAVVIRLAPETTSGWFAHIPLAGATFASDQGLMTKVELRNVQGRFQRLRNDRRVFVISGDARNNSAVTLERIEVEGALYDLAGGEVDQKIVTTGNRTALKDLSEAEIVLLQRLDPTIALAPGDTTPFLIVFLEPPRELREFSSRVSSVRPTRRASTPPAPASSRRDSVG
jgi:hypothetical protein